VLDDSNVVDEVEVVGDVVVDEVFGGIVLVFEEVVASDVLPLPLEEEEEEEEDDDDQVVVDVVVDVAVGVQGSSVVVDVVVDVVVGTTTSKLSATII